MERSSYPDIKVTFTLVFGSRTAGEKRVAPCGFTCVSLLSPQQFSSPSGSACSRGSDLPRLSPTGAEMRSSASRPLMVSHVSFTVTVLDILIREGYVERLPGAWDLQDIRYEMEEVTTDQGFALILLN